MRNFQHGTLLYLTLVFCFIFCPYLSARTAKVVLKDGRIYEGRIAELSKVDEKAEDVGKVRIKLIIMLEDGLRYVYFPKYNIQPDLKPEPSAESNEIFKTGIQYSREGRTPEVLGEYNPFINFDRFGRRLLPLRHYGGTEYVSQGITEITPQYIRVRGIHINNNPFVWDMRLATNSLPREQLTPILMNRIDQKNYDDRVRLVRFYYQANQYDNAVEELDGILHDWGDSPEVKQKLSGVTRMIDLQRHRRWLDELDQRYKAGQFQLVKKFLLELDAKEDLPEQLFMTVRRMLQRYNDYDKQRAEIILRLRSLYDKLPKEEKDERILPILAEIEKDLSLSTIERLSAFQLYADEGSITDSEKLAIGITNWFAGANADNRRLTTAVTLPEVRSLVLEYLQSGDDVLTQKEIIEKLKTLEAAKPDIIAKVLYYLKPPKANPKDEPERPGYYRFEIDSPLAGTVAKLDYVVQLPPEYDPNRRYPMLVTLNGLSATPDSQIDWWAGTWRGNERYGQASRHGYIVIAPNWNPQKLLEYDFSALSHAAVLYAVKDAFRRFSVDTDRVFITGHGLGGTAAWDIALAHPDLWAGAIPFNAIASKYIIAYQKNVQHVPFYLITGELEGAANSAIFKFNAMVYNRYLAQQSKPNEVTVVRFIGRGMEMFPDEIIRLFEWMKLHHRNFEPLGFEAETMRPWDNFFWGVELGNLAKDKPDYVRDPMFFPDKGGLPKNMIQVSMKQMKANNSVQFNVGPKLPNVVIYLTPNIIDFNAKASVKVGNKDYHPKNGYVEPSIEVMLYDAKTRGDRLHPFWARLDGK
ncbi:MAG: alpha/beta hydrolase-fold protein [Planctomycetaceae bacterium]|nr:alpha/beta hydrolase-fold protein [Planctomycetaceae bacterium]